MEVWTSLSTENTHTDRYLHFQSHHPTREERPGEVPSQQSQGIISSQDKLQKEVDHLARVLRQNGYPTKFISSASAPLP